MSQWKLRILNTSYKDAEVHLSDEQILGRNEHKADLVIDDAKVFEEHVRISTSEEGVKIEPLDEKVRIQVDGQSWDESLALPMLQPLRLGELIIMLAEEGIDWPAKLPDFDQLEMTAAVPQASAKENAPVHKGYKHAATLLSLGAVVTLVFAVVIYFQIKESTPKVVAPKVDVQQTKQIIGTDSHPHLSLAWDDINNKLSLSGYVETTSDRKALLNRVETLNIRYTSDIRTMDEIKSAARFILKNLELDAIDIKSGTEAGSLVFVTDSNSLAAWGRVEQILQRDIPGLTSWQLDIIEEQPALEQLKTLLEASSFANKVIVEDKGDRIELVGNLSGSELREFKGLKQEFMKRFGSNPHLLLTTPKLKEDDNADINLRFRAVRIGAVPYLILDNGQKYFEGARLPNGARIASIRSGGVYLQNDQKTYIVNFDSTL